MLNVMTKSAKVHAEKTEICDRVREKEKKKSSTNSNNNELLVISFRAAASTAAAAAAAGAAARNRNAKMPKTQLILSRLKFSHCFSGTK